MSTVDIARAWLKRNFTTSIWAVAGVLYKIKQVASCQAPPFSRCCLVVERRRCCF
jgi:hypothetical protein